MSYIKCGDCKELLKAIPDKSVDLVIIDPPYLFDNSVGGGAFGSNKKKYHVDYAHVSNYNNGNTLVDTNENMGFTEETISEIIRVMKKVNIYIWCSKSQLLWLMEKFKDYNMDLLTWHKTNPCPTCNNKYLSDTEYLLFFRENGVKLYGEYATKKKFYVTPINKSDKDKYGHPTIKPLDIIKNLIINSSNEGDTVLDCFMGSGTTCVASKELGREYIGFELQEEYFEIAKKRLEETEDKELTIDDLLKQLGGV